MSDASPPLTPTLGAVSGWVMMLVWFVGLARLARGARTIPVLSAASHAGPAGPVPTISVVLAAKDEERNIEACVRLVLAQDHPAFDLVVIDDRSTDRTPTILAELSREHAGRMKVLTVKSLPEGWGGQNNALRLGTQASTGEWLCFTDADCRFDSARALSVAWHEAQGRRADLLSILPRMDAPTAFERIYLPVCCLMFMVGARVTEVNDPATRAAYANGAFLLVRRAAYEALGGHERVRGQLNDDIALAGLAKRAGMRLVVTGTSDLYRTRMYGSVLGAWNGWTRNFYGTLREPRKLVATLGAAIALLILPWLLFGVSVGLSSGIDPHWRAAAVSWGAAVLTSHVGMARGYAARGFRVLASVLYPLAALFVTGMVARAALRALRRAGTVWHGARYE